MKRYPFKFLEAYNSDDTDIFFGRDKEIDELYEMVFQNSILLVYGASGTGKTSLIQCGLAKKFKSYEWMPLIVRRGNEINASLEKVLTDAGGALDENDLENEENLSGLSQLIQNVYLNHFKPIYLIFDQFEELYILGNKDEEKKFIESIKEILLSKYPVKLIFSIREEYLGYLNDFERDIPQLLRKKLRVENMAREKLKDFLHGINGNRHSIVKVREGEIGEIADDIFKKLTGNQKSQFVPLPYLQVFLDKIYLELTKDEDHKTDAEISWEIVQAIGDIGDVLSDFLESQVKIISEEKSKTHGGVGQAIIWKILSEFATLEGTKKPIHNKKGQSQSLVKGVDKALVDDCIPEFVKRRILKILDTSAEEDSYELAHDSLAKCIAEKRSGEERRKLEIEELIKNQLTIVQDLFDEKQLIRIEPFLQRINLNQDALKLIDESKKAVEKQKSRKRRRLQLTFAVMAIALVTFIYLTVEASVQKQKAQKSLIDAYKAEIDKFEKEIYMERINLGSIKTYKAPDVEDRVEFKIDSLDGERKKYKTKMDSVLNKLSVKKL